MKLKLTKAEHTKPQRCLKCGQTNDAASGIVDKHARNALKPKPGDIMLCLYCGHAMRLDHKMAFRELTADERLALTTDPKVRTARVALDRVIKARTKH